VKLTDKRLKKLIKEGILDFITEPAPQHKAAKELKRLKKLMGAESGKDTDLVWKNHLRDKLDIVGSWNDYLSTQKWKARDPEALNKFRKKIFEVIEEELTKMEGK
jgi:hypothetical protein